MRHGCRGGDRAVGDLLVQGHGFAHRLDRQLTAQQLAAGFELLERLGGVAPERAVFVDDWPGNVAAARRLGMRGVVVDLDPTAALAELDALLGW